LPNSWNFYAYLDLFSLFFPTIYSTPSNSSWIGSNCDLKFAVFAPCGCRDFQNLCSDPQIRKQTKKIPCNSLARNTNIHTNLYKVVLNYEHKIVHEWSTQNTEFKFQFFQFLNQDDGARAPFIQLQFFIQICVLFIHTTLFTLHKVKSYFLFYFLLLFAFKSFYIIFLLILIFFYYFSITFL